MSDDDFGRRLLMVALSAVFAILAGVVGLVLRLLWGETHRPVIGFLWLFLVAVFFREMLTALILIGAAADLLPQEGVLLTVLGVGWFGTQFVTAVPATGLGLFVMGVIDERWIRWLFRPPPSTGSGSDEGDVLPGGENTDG